MHVAAVAFDARCCFANVRVLVGEVDIRVMLRADPGDALAGWRELRGAHARQSGRCGEEE